MLPLILGRKANEHWVRVMAVDRSVRRSHCELLCLRRSWWIWHLDSPSRNELLCQWQSGLNFREGLREGGHVYAQAHLILVRCSLFTEGKVFFNLSHRHNFSLDEIVKENPDVQLGGQWRPWHCTARHKVAIVIPYR